MNTERMKEMLSYFLSSPTLNIVSNVFYIYIDFFFHKTIAVLAFSVNSYHQLPF